MRYINLLLTLTLTLTYIDRGHAQACPPCSLVTRVTTATKLGRLMLGQFVRCEHSHRSAGVQH